MKYHLIYLITLLLWSSWEEAIAVVAVEGLNCWEQLSILSKEILSCEGSSWADGFTWEVTRKTKELRTIIISVILIAAERLLW